MRGRSSTEPRGDWQRRATGRRCLTIGRSSEQRILRRVASDRETVDAGILYR
ncbi:hypothetical protein RB9485 [Rhodopirellula baltica SH 1]|uniref:Uncharacterized protein n=1 Tax=Rhodopirellula baltica (strain DSM 10527 / NCIMB 13988 / SH1) TaxID=243090 RepID=Q7ULI5_RHOBA|nr:hypothetical protein RB9485 [Rhodopirellula baltica SH 1]